MGVAESCLIEGDHHMTYIKGGLIIDGTGADPLRNGAIVVDKAGEITKVVSLDETPVPTEAEVVDWSDYTLLPGMIDSHTHLGLGYTKMKGLVDQLRTPLSLLAIEGFINLQRDVRSGVTTMRALGDAEGLEVTVRDAIACKEIPGPRLLASVEVRPSHGTGLTDRIEDGPTAIRTRIRKGIQLGADLVKLFASNIKPGNSEEAYRRGDLTTIAAYTEEEIYVAVEEAHRVGVKIAVHALGGPALRWALQAGADSIEHANLLEEDEIGLFLETGAYLSDPNLQLFFDEETGFESRKSWTSLPSWWRDKVELSREKTRDVQREALRRGVRFALGTDSNHGQLWREAKHFVDVLGATPMQAVLALTRNSADVLGLGAEVGTLEPGKRADLIAVCGNPLEDISCLKTMHAVMMSGETVVPNDDACLSTSSVKGERR